MWQLGEGILNRPVNEEEDGAWHAVELQVHQGQLFISLLLIPRYPKRAEPPDALLSGPLHHVLRSVLSQVD